MKWRGLVKCSWKVWQALSIPMVKMRFFAAEGMSKDINDVMHGLADEMTTALPTDFSVNGTVNRNDTISGAGFGGGALITIQQMIVRAKRISARFPRNFTT